MEYKHHGDELVPRQQRFGQYTRSLMKGLGVPVMNQYGLRPAVVKGTGEIAPLTIYQGSRQARPAQRGDDVQFPSTPAALRADQRRRQVGPRALAASRSTWTGPILSPKRATRSSTPASGCRPQGERGGHIVLADSTIFTTLFGGTESLEHFWANFVGIK